MGMSIELTAESLRYYLTTEPVAPRPTGWEISLHTGAPGIDGSDNEVTDSTYARQPISFEVVETDPAQPRAINSEVVVFPAASAGFDVSHIVIWDTDGGMQISQSLRAVKHIAPAEQAQVAPGEITIGVL